MAGLLALLSFEDDWPIKDFIKYGLESLSHRGEYGVVCFRASGSVRCVEYSDSIPSISGSAIAAWMEEDSRELQVAERGSSAIIFDRPGKHVDDVANIVDVALSSTNIQVKLPKLLDGLTGVDIPSFVALSSRGEIIAWRSNSGLTPLAVGGYGFDMVIASSESFTIEMLDADVRRYLSPGEGLYISRNLVKTFRTTPLGRCGLCLLELLSIARHDSIIDGVNTYEFRKVLGEELGKYLNNQVDVVVGIPETATPYAIGLSQYVGAKYETAFIASSRRVRSLLKRELRDRVAIAQLKLSPIREVLDGKKVALVDDVVVTGYTLKTASQILRYKVGVSELHALIASPRIVEPCPYGIMRLDRGNLIAAHLDDNSIRRFLEVDSITWLREGDLERVAKAFGIRLCGRCFGMDLIGGS